MEWQPKLDALSVAFDAVIADPWREEGHASLAAAIAGFTGLNLTPDCGDQLGGGFTQQLAGAVADKLVAFSELPALQFAASSPGSNSRPLHAALRLIALTSPIADYAVASAGCWAPELCDAATRLRLAAGARFAAVTGARALTAGRADAGWDQEDTELLLRPVLITVTYLLHSACSVPFLHGQLHTKLQAALPDRVIADWFKACATAMPPAHAVPGE